MVIQDVEFPWQEMSLEEFANFKRAQGDKVLKVRDVYWQKTRPFFYRPLLAFRELPADSVTAPWPARFGGFQHAVPSQQRQNSFLNMLIFDDPETYSLQNLDWNRRKQIKVAAKQFVIRQVQDEREFKQKAYPVYLSFYERTQYNYHPERRYKEHFDRWAESLFRTPKIVVLGGYRDGELGAISITQWVEDTLMYSTVFCNTESLKRHINGLMLHVVRAAVAGRPEVKQIFAGPYKYEAGKGVDDFYLVRGCKLVKKAALLHVNPLASFALKRLRPNEHAKLWGKLDGIGGSGATSQEGLTHQSAC